MEGLFSEKKDNFSNKPPLSLKEQNKQKHKKEQEIREKPNLFSEFPVEYKSPEGKPFGLDDSLSSSFSKPVNLLPMTKSPQNNGLIPQYYLSTPSPNQIPQYQAITSPKSPHFPDEPELELPNAYLNPNSDKKINCFSVNGADIVNFEMQQELKKVKEKNKKLKREQIERNEEIDDKNVKIKEMDKKIEELERMVVSLNQQKENLIGERERERETEREKEQNRIGTIDAIPSPSRSISAIHLINNEQEENSLDRTLSRKDENSLISYIPTIEGSPNEISSTKDKKYPSKISHKKEELLGI